MKETLNVIETKEDYEKYKHLIKKHLQDHDLERILLGAEDYYTSTGLNEIDWDMYRTWFVLNNPMLKEEKRKMFEAIFESLKASSGTEYSDALVGTLMEQYYAERIAFLSMKVAEGKAGADLTAVRKELEEYAKSSGATVASVPECVTDDLDELLNDTAAGTGLEWRLPALNESLGDLRLGDFVMFCGRPESGKSSMLYSEATYMATQLTDDRKIIFFTNEERGRKVKQRLWSALLGVDLATLKSDPALYKANYESALNGDKSRIIVVENHNLSIDDIEYWLSNNKVALICIDQIRKIKGLNDLKGIQRLEGLFQFTRELAKDVAPVLTVGQLDASAENTQYPTMASMYESKTAAQGELDVQVNIGQIDGSVPENARWLNIVKNKMETPGVEASRHAKHEVAIHSTIARFT